LTTLEQITQKLKTTRESKGLTVEQICDKTKIPLHHLQGLEEGRFDDLPEPIYVSGFIKLYANQLGLNGQLLANEYRDWADSEDPNTQLNSKNSRIKSAPDVPIIVSSDYYQKNKIETSPPTFKTIYFNIIMIVLVLGLISYLGMTQFNNYSNQLEANNPTPSPNASPKSAADTSAGPGSNSTASGTASTTAPSRNQLVINANKHVWVEVKSAATGDNLYIGFLEPGSQKTFDAPQQGLRVRATDGADVSISYQGKTSVLGIAGEETEKVFAPDTTAGVPLSPPATAGLPRTGTTTATSSTTAINSTTPSTGAATGTATTAKPTTASAATSTTLGAGMYRRHWQRSPAAVSDGQPYKYGDGRLDTE
jgi:cytoskeletal protein RodZ